MFDITITEGTVVVSGLYTIIDHDDVKVLHVDLASKYPGPLYHGGSDDTIAVYIPAAPDTLNTDRIATDTTEIRFTLPNALGWVVVAGGARYTVRIVLYRLPGAVRVGELVDHLTGTAESDSEPRSAGDPY